MKAITLLVAYFGGILLLPILLLITKKDAIRLNLLDSVYGNSVDGLGGDFGTNPMITMPDNFLTKAFPRYYWLAIRNPAHNLGLSYGAHGIIKEVWRNKDDEHTAGNYKSWVILQGDSTKRVFRYGHIKVGPKYIRYAFGPKIWALNPAVHIGSGDVLAAGDKYRNYWKPGDRISEGYAMSVAIRSEIT